jgi:hypothetical protein
MKPPRGALAAVLLGALLLPCEAAGYEFPSMEDRFHDWALNCAGPTAIAGNLSSASWRQWVTNEPAEWGQDGAGFARRLRVASVNTVLVETSLSVGSAAMGQDANYYRSPREGLLPRGRHALVMTFVARDREGGMVFSPSKTIAPFIGPIVVQNTLYPKGYTLGNALLSGAYSLLINAGLNAAKEFVLGAPEWNGGE